MAYGFYFFRKSKLQRRTFEMGQTKPSTKKTLWMAGPMLDVYEERHGHRSGSAPWDRPDESYARFGNKKHTNAREDQWTPAHRKMYANGIPLTAQALDAPTRIDSRTTCQATVNECLRGLQRAADARLASSNATLPPEATNRTWGVTIFDREVAAKAVKHRNALFGDPFHPANALGTELRNELSQYATQSQAGVALEPKGGTIFLLAGCDNLLNAIQTHRGREVVSSYADLPLEKLPVYGTNPYSQGSEDPCLMWHNQAMLVLYLPPIKGVNGVPDVPAFRGVYIYDPSFPSEGANEPASIAIRNCKRPRLCDFLYFSRIRGLLGHWRKDTPKWAGTMEGNKIYIGGGGNVPGDCRAMAANFMDMCVTIVEDLNAAFYSFQLQPNSLAAYAAHEAAMRELKDFFSDFVLLSA